MDTNNGYCVQKNNDKMKSKFDNGNGIPQKYQIKYFSHSSPQNQQDREQDWDCR
jgi:hypothetical protein